MFDDLTLEQFCALDYHRNMVVTSGPGAGKTRILSYRYCFILLTDPNVSTSEILTLTFTEKAAEEMKNRIYEMLNRLEKDILKGGETGAIQRIRECREQFHRNRISTIHSFCADLLREHPVESGIDPGFIIIQGAGQKKVMDESIEKAVKFIRRNREDLFAPLFQMFGGRNQLVRFLRNIIAHPFIFESIFETKERLFGIKDWKSLVFRDYCRLIKDRYIIPYLDGIRSADNIKGHFDELLELLEDWHGYSGEDEEFFGIPELFRKLRNMAGERRRYGPSLTIEEGSLKISYIQLVEEFYPDIFHDDSPDGVFEKELNLFMEVAGLCLEQYQREKTAINALDFADLEALSYKFLFRLNKNAPNGIFKRIQDRFNYIMVDEFQDTNRVQWEIIRMLCTNVEERGKEKLQTGKLFVVGDKRQAIYRFRGGDVTVFESVIQKIKDSNPENPFPMFWKDKELCKRIRKIFSNHSGLWEKQVNQFNSLSGDKRKDIIGGDIYLPVNFRTASYPVAFINRVFNEIFSNKGCGILKGYETSPRMIKSYEKRDQDKDHMGSVTIYLTDASSPRKIQAEREASLIAFIIEGILGKYGEENNEYHAYPDIRLKIEKKDPAIGILFFTFNHLKAFESAFREAGIPFVIHRGKGFYRSEEVMEMLQLLNYLVDERDRISLLAAMRSPILGVSDPEIFEFFYGCDAEIDPFALSKNSYIRKIGDQIQSWRFLSSRLTIAGLIRKIVDGRSLTAIHSVHPNGIQRMANIEKLIEISRRFQQDGNGSLPEFVEYCIEMADQEEEEGEAIITSVEGSPITLMTIHAAKGLEFPMVIIPDLARNLPDMPRAGKPVRLYSDERGTGSWNGREGELPVWPVEIPQLNYKKKYGPLAYLLLRRNRLEDIAEYKRVFYVGCTRTEDHLILLGTVKKGDLQKESQKLTSEDYRERSSIMELMDDIYGFKGNFRPESGMPYGGEKGFPSIVWKEIEPRKFRGIIYEKNIISNDSFGSMDGRIKGLDLSSPVMVPPYFQLSFKSIDLYLRCPIRFYYNTVLGLKLNGLNAGRDMDEMILEEDESESREYGETYDSRSALLLGSLVHEYLEKHQFGEGLDEKQFIYLWERINHSVKDDQKSETNPITIREKARNHIINTISDNNLVALLKNSVYYREVPFMINSSDGVEFRGVIDMLFRDNKRGLWSIIDWKSNSIGLKDPMLAVRENRYDIQLATYRWAIKRISGEEVAGLFIYFTEAGRLIECKWEGDPKHLIEEMIQRVRDYEKDRDIWIRDLEKYRGSNKKCTFCAYYDMICDVNRTKNDLASKQKL